MSVNYFLLETSGGRFRVVMDVRGRGKEQVFQNGSADSRTYLPGTTLAAPLQPPSSEGKSHLSAAADISVEKDLTPGGRINDIPCHPRLLSECGGRGVKKFPT